TDSEAMLVAGVQLAKKAWAEFGAYVGWDAAGIDCVVTHQVGREHRRKLYEALGIELAKDFSIFETWGNIGSAAAPMALAHAIDAQRVPDGGRVAVLGIGSGLSTCMLALENLC
ncbi:MAG TPA: 3-oxoacyl-[acyl-carrier-protein] synthase III C-terminal domain-containing protein, partial [Opitutales bacterium]|nr:3-oxoacyl-[acyl-carrier-protein] synthase III C-terminal domain-containing protein [Opitutales bacterium]